MIGAYQDHTGQRIKALETRVETLENLYNKVCQRLRVIEGTPLLSRVDLGEAAHREHG